MIDVGGRLLPVTVNDGREGFANCYVVCPRTLFGAYCREEDCRNLPWPLRLALEPLFAVVEQGLAFGHFDHVVHLNNWLVATNLFPDGLTPAQCVAAMRRLSREHPGRAVVWRSLLRRRHAEVIAGFAAAGCVLLPTRRVWLFDTTSVSAMAAIRRHNSAKTDFRKFRAIPCAELRGADMGLDDFRRAAELYRMLYIEKYTALNPQYSPEWLRRGTASGWPPGGRGRAPGWRGCPRSRPGP